MPEMKYSTFVNDDRPTEENHNSKTTSTATDAGKTFTIDEAVETMGYGPYQLSLCFMSGFAWMADSMEMMILSILGPVLWCEWGLVPTKQALITTMCFLGMSLGSVFYGKIADKFGRKISLIISSCHAFYFGLLSSLSPLYAWIIITRSLVGFAIGGCAQAITLYSEVLKSATRGRNILLIDLFWSLGAVVEIFLAWAIIPSAGWRWWIAISGFPLVIFVILCIWIRESPRHSLASGDYTGAMETLHTMSRLNKVPLPKGKLVGDTTESRGRLKDLISSKYMLLSIIQFGIWFVSAFSYYGLALFSTELINAGSVCNFNTPSGVSTQGTCMLECNRLNDKDYLDLLSTTASEIPGILITALIIDKIGRKLTLAIELFIFSIACFCLMICYNRTWMVVLLMIARASISGVFQAAYVYTSEIYPTHMRGVGLATCSAFGRFGAMVTPFIAQVLLTSSVHAALVVYAIATIIGGIGALLMPIETKGRQM